MHRGYEIKEALRAQMEVQSKLHLQVEVNFIFIVQVVCIYGLMNFLPHLNTFAHQL
jgi:hypothetical protein